MRSSITPRIRRAHCDSGGTGARIRRAKEFTSSISRMNIRLYQPLDNTVVARLFADTLRAVNSAHYSPEQIELWVATTCNHIERWHTDIGNLINFVAEIDSEIVGFATFEPNGHLMYLYVDHRFHRRGVASALVQRVEQEAAARGLPMIFAEVSITARPFFEHAGFQVMAPQTFVVQNVSYLFYRMEKQLP